MATIQNVLFPVDFTPSCTAMAPFVQRAAAMFGAKVTLLHVVVPSASGFELLVRPLRDADEDRRVVACSLLETYLSTEFPPSDTERLVVIGDAATRIAEVARDRGFEAIVMPTHAGVFRQMLLGSTTAKVLNDADCLVMTTQHAETISPRPLEHRKWVCAIGLSADSERVLRLANETAQTIHASLYIIHAIAPVEPGLPMQLGRATRVEEKRAARERLDKLQSAVGSHVPVDIVVGPIKEALVEAARRLHANALIIGRSSLPGRQGRLRDLTYAMVRDAPCPVLSV